MEDENLKKQLSSHPLNITLVEVFNGKNEGMYDIVRSFSIPGDRISTNYTMPKGNQTVLSTWSWPDGTEAIEYYKLKKVNGSLKGFKIEVKIKKNENHWTSTDVTRLQSRMFRQEVKWRFG